MSGIKKHLAELADKPAKTITIAEFVKKFHYGTIKFGIDQLKEALNTYNIRMIYTSEKGSSPVKYTLFTLNGTNLDARGEQERAFNNECNGYIFDAQTFEPICIPSRQLHDSAPAVASTYADACATATIKKIQDGTTVNLYTRDKHIWTLSTAHAFDATNMQFMGPLTYAQIVNKLLNEKYPELAKRINFKLVDKHIECNLDTNYSYTFIFHYKDFHPVGEDNIWQVHAANLRTGELNEAYFPELPQLETVDSIDVPSQYGFIIRYASATRNDIIIRNEYMQFIKNVFYTVSKDENAIINANNRKLYLIIRAYLGPHRERLASILDVSAEYSKLETTIEEFIMAVIHTARRRVTVGESETTKYTPFVDKFIEQTDIQPLLTKIMSKPIKDVISDYARNVSYAYSYLTLMSL